MTQLQEESYIALSSSSAHKNLAIDLRTELMQVLQILHIIHNCLISGSRANELAQVEAW